MTHRVGQISDAIAALHSASTTLGAAVFQDREFSLEEGLGELPCITINEGDDTPLSENGYDNLGFIDTQVDFELKSYAVGIDEPTVKVELRRLRAESHIVMLAHLVTFTNPLGLSFVHAVRYGGASASEISVLGEQTAGSMACAWRVQYRMNLTNPN